MSSRLEPEPGLVRAPASRRMPRPPPGIVTWTRSSGLAAALAATVGERLALAGRHSGWRDSDDSDTKITTCQVVPVATAAV